MRVAVFFLSSSYLSVSLSMHSVKGGSAPVGNCLAHLHTQAVRQQKHPVCAHQEKPGNRTIVSE